jgi:hypothetical protein
LQLEFICDEDVYFELFLGNRLLTFGEGTKEIINSIEINPEEVYSIDEETKIISNLYGLVVVELLIYSIESDSKGLVSRPSKVKIIDPTKNRSVTFLFPNQKLDAKELDKYVNTSAEIEKLTNINISPQLPANLQGLENVRANLKDW